MDGDLKSLQYMLKRSNLLTKSNAFIALYTSVIISKGLLWDLIPMKNKEHWKQKLIQNIEVLFIYFLNKSIWIQNLNIRAE